GDETDRVAPFQPARQHQQTDEAFFNRADAHASRRKKIQEPPNSVAPRYGLAEKLLNRSNYAKAAVQFQKVMELDLDNHEGKTDLSQYNYALSLASQAKFDDALAQLDLLQKRFPQSGAVADATVL